jgi:hypothetical protein
MYSADFEQRALLDGERVTDERLEYDEWQAIFFFELIGYCPFVSRAELETIDGNAWNHLWKQRFQEAIPDYPLLARMWNQHEDAFYTPDEIDSLRFECLSVQSKATNALALKGLETLIRWCNEASKGNLGLFMACG